MNRLFLLMAVAAVLSFSCEKNKDKNEEVTAIDKESKAEEVDTDINSPDLEEIPVLRKCYKYKEDDLEIEMNLELEDEVVTGQLVYSGSQNQEGSIIGEFEGDTLMVTYKYKENEVPKTKEMLFLRDRENYSLQMANVELNEEENIKTIKNKMNVKFDGILLQKDDCPQVQ